MDLLSTAVDCPICFIPIDPKKSDITKLSCGHTYHATCAHFFLVRQYGYCKVCLESKPELLQVFNDEEHKQISGPPSATILLAKQQRQQFQTEEEKILFEAHPLDFGDDRQLSLLIKKRLCLLRLVSPYRESSNYNNNANNARKMNPSNQIQQSTPSTTGDTLSVKDFEQFMESRELSSQQQQLNPNVNTNSQQQQQEESLSSKLSNLVRKSIHVNLAPDDTWLKLETNPIELFYYQRPITEISERYKIDSKVLIAQQVRIENLFEKGYTIEDLMVIGASWSDLKSLFLTADVWSRYKTKISTKLLVNYLHISIADVMDDICHRDMNQFLRIGFTCEEMCLLQATTPILISYGLTKYHMPYFTHLTMSDWNTKLGLTDRIMAKVMLIEPFFLFPPNNIPSSSSSNTTTTSQQRQHHNQQQQSFIITLGWLTRDHTAQIRLAEFLKYFPNYTNLVNIQDPSTLLVLSLK